MNDEHEKQWAEELDRELKSLPELPAPDTLIPSVMAAIERPTPIRVPWYRRPWPQWPVGLQTASMMVLLAFFGGLCRVGWGISHGETLPAALHGISEWISSWRSLGSAIIALVQACALIINKLGTVFTIACLTLVACSYAACIALGTALVRFTFARRTNPL
jgi:hypothetical protein